MVTLFVLFESCLGAEESRAHAGSGRYGAAARWVCFSVERA